MKAFIAEGTGAAQQLSGIQNEKIPIYGSKVAAEADLSNLAENQIVATKENGFSSDGVYVVNSPAIVGGELIANSSMKIMFTSDIVGEDTSAPLSISWNGESYLVKVANNSQLQNIYAHEVSSGVFKYIQAYTTLELIFDGVQFIIVGNPLVLSSSTYSIYANGWNDTDEYSTNEVKTNKVWIDGKPIYRKCFYSATGYTPNQTIGNITNLDKVLNIICNVFNNSNKSVYPNFDDGIEGFYVVNTVNGDVIARLSGDFLGSNPQSCIVEYTKTTD